MSLLIAAASGFATALQRSLSICVVLFTLLLGNQAAAQPLRPATAPECAPRVLSVAAARAQVQLEEAGAKPPTATATAVLATRPTAGWEPVTLPDVWTRRWPDYGGRVWYRIEWERSCDTGTRDAEPLALGLSGVSMAAGVFINDDLLWRDASMVEPLSRSWNMPRAFLLPGSTLHKGVNTVWVRVMGQPQLTPGLGVLQLGPAPEVMLRQENNQWRQRTVYLISLGLSGAVGCLFLVVWCMRRAERAYGWYAAMSLCWVAYVATLLVLTPWPLSDTLSMSRANIVAFVLYVLCFCLFTFRFGQQTLVRTEKLLWTLAGVGIVAVLLAPESVAGNVMSTVWMAFVLIVFTTASSSSGTPGELATRSTCCSQYAGCSCWWWAYTIWWWS